jgi:hypothetical protein
VSSKPFEPSEPTLIGQSVRRRGRTLDRLLDLSASGAEVHVESLPLDRLKNTTQLGIEQDITVATGILKLDLDSRWGLNQLGNCIDVDFREFTAIDVDVSVEAIL